MISLVILAGLLEEENAGLPTSKKLQLIHRDGAQRLSRILIWVCIVTQTCDYKAVDHDKVQVNERKSVDPFLDRSREVALAPHEHCMNCQITAVLPLLGQL